MHPDALPNKGMQPDQNARCGIALSVSLGSEADPHLEILSVRFRVNSDRFHVAFPGVGPPGIGDNRPRSTKSAVRA